MNTVAIAGVGLIGGSFGLALRKAGFEGEIVGVSSQRSIEAGKRTGAISRSATLEEAAESADLIYLAQPVDRILRTLEILGPIAHRRCLITDVGSTKAAIVEKASTCVRVATFAGGHPIAGKERRGAEAADADLFRDRPYVLTPTTAETPAVRTFREWLSRIGAKVIDLGAPEHDAIVALTSHLPQLISSALAHMLAERKSKYVKEVFGPGLLDMTRLALSSPEVWQSIVATNKAEILRAMDAFVDSLSQARNAVASDDLRDFFVSAGTFAHALRDPDRTRQPDL